VTSNGQKRSKAATRALASRHGVPQRNRDSLSVPLEKHPEKCWTSKDYILWPYRKSDQDPGDVPTTVGVNRVGSAGTNYVTGDLVAGPVIEPDVDRLPKIESKGAVP